MKFRNLSRFVILVEPNMIYFNNLNQGHVYFKYHNATVSYEIAMFYDHYGQYNYTYCPAKEKLIYVYNPYRRYIYRIEKVYKYKKIISAEYTFSKDYPAYTFKQIFYRDNRVSSVKYYNDTLCHYKKEYAYDDKSYTVYFDTRISSNRTVAICQNEAVSN